LGINEKDITKKSDNNNRLEHEGKKQGIVQANLENLKAFPLLFASIYC
jgi:hypothetical protein